MAAWLNGRTCGKLIELTRRVRHGSDRIIRERRKIRGRERIIVPEDFSLQIQDGDRHYGSFRIHKNTKFDRWPSMSPSLRQKRYCYERVLDQFYCVRVRQLGALVILVSFCSLKFDANAFGGTQCRTVTAIDVIASTRAPLQHGDRAWSWLGLLILSDIQRQGVAITRALTLRLLVIFGTGSPVL